PGSARETQGPVAASACYPPAPYHSSAWRARLMDVTYDAIVEIDRDLRARSLDLHAKHWAIHAVRGGPAPPPRVSRAPADREDEWRLQGACDAAYESVAIPSELPRAQEVTVEVMVRNLSWRLWTSEHSARPILLSYHWLDPARRAVEYDGLRTRLPRPLAPGDGCAAA